jgi:hypothetical protein
MRITKKFAGASCLGRRVYHLCDTAPPTAADLERAKMELTQLERRFRLRVERGQAGLPLGDTMPLPSPTMSGGSLNNNLQHENNHSFLHATAASSGTTPNVSWHNPIASVASSNTAPTPFFLPPPPLPKTSQLLPQGAVPHAAWSNVLQQQQQQQTLWLAPTTPGTLPVPTALAPVAANAM